MATKKTVKRAAKKPVVKATKKAAAKKPAKKVKQIKAANGVTIYIV